ncbi:MAG TPA: glycosyltransferase N-terminal domain-containing protein, partial [Thermoanaerobaculia bacterium]|nr:glycosyltransferase N-terminal domain-containing protein [Thermoanaerobaculia bacterium]
MFFLYDVVAAIVAGIVLRPIARLRLACGRATDAEVRERLGRIAPPHSARRPRIVLHAVSAGEMAAAGAVAEAIAARLPDAGFFLTTGNADGRAAGERLRERLPGATAPGFLPWDRRKFVERWLAAADPDAVAVVETEIWPNLFRACGRAGLPLFVVNGRVPDGDFRRYRIGRFFFRPVLANVRTILARSAEDARRFVAIGAPAARVRDAGNVKFDAAAAAGPFDAAAQERATRPSEEAALRLVAGSTHAPEERLLIEAAAALRTDFPGLSLVIAPRRVRRAKAILRRARAAGFRAALTSESDAAAEIRILDAIGGLAGAYSNAAIAVVGGSFSRHG